MTLESAPPSLSSNVCSGVGLSLQAVTTLNSTMHLALPDIQNKYGGLTLCLSGESTSLAVMKPWVRSPPPQKPSIVWPRGGVRKISPSTAASTTLTFRSARNTGNTQQWAREDQSFQHLHWGSLTTANDFSSGESNVLFWPSWAPSDLHASTHVQE